MDNSNPYGVVSFFQQIDAVGMGVLLILLVMSIASWYLIVLKTMRSRQMRRQIIEFLESFWNAPSIDAVAAQHLDQNRIGHCANLLVEGVKEDEAQTLVGLAVRDIGEQNVVNQ